MDIAFIGFGGAAFGLAKGLKQDGVANVFFYDPASSKPPYDQVVARRADETGAIGRDTLEELIASADVVISCVTGSVAASAARDAAPHLRPGQLYVDVNTASPDVMEQAAASVAGAGAVFVDAAMMGGIPTYLHKVPTLASGAGAERFKELLSPYNMSITVLGDKPGQASAIKMFRSIFMKGVLGLLLEVMEASNKYDASDLVLSSVAGTMDKTPFLETARLIATKEWSTPSAWLMRWRTWSKPSSGWGPPERCRTRPDKSWNGAPAWGSRNASRGKSRKPWPIFCPSYNHVTDEAGRAARLIPVTRWNRGSVLPLFSK